VLAAMGQMQATTDGLVAQLRRTLPAKPANKPLRAKRGRTKRVS
jgi:hypothetical protein